MFKKREPKGNSRKNVDKSDESNDKDGSDDEVDFSAIAEVKDRQNQRKRVKHEFSELPLIDDSNSKSLKKSEAVKSIETMITNQFSVTKSQGDRNGILTHEAIMGKYISDKLGVAK